MLSKERNIKVKVHGFLDILWGWLGGEEKNLSSRKIIAP